jgi:hypothetical protein
MDGGVILFGLAISRTGPSGLSFYEDDMSPFLQRSRNILCLNPTVQAVPHELTGTDSVFALVSFGVGEGREGVEEIAHDGKNHLFNWQFSAVS